MQVSFIDNKFTNASKALIKSSTFLAFTFWSFSYRPTPSLVFVSILSFILGLALIIGRYTDKTLQKTTKFTLESFFKSQKYGQIQAIVALALTLAQLKPQKQFFKAYFSKLHLRNFDVACYKFCQQCENYFNMARVTELN